MASRFVVEFQGPSGSPLLVEAVLDHAIRTALDICSALPAIAACTSPCGAAAPLLSVRVAGAARPYVVEGFHTDGRWFCHEVAAVDALDAEFQGRWAAVASLGRPRGLAELAARLEDLSVWSIDPLDARGARLPVVSLSRPDAACQPLVDLH
jgi:hypothetical protein